jgi:hypothetical protein
MSILQIKAARSAQLCANTATFALILPRAAISLILSVTAYYTVAYNQWLLNSTLYPFVFVCFSVCGSVFLFEIETFLKEYIWKIMKYQLI